MSNHKNIDKSMCNAFKAKTKSTDLKTIFKSYRPDGETKMEKIVKAPHKTNKFEKKCD